MAENSKIEWTDATWNPITGCSVVSPGCTNCYAMGLAGGESGPKARPSHPDWFRFLRDQCAEAGVPFFFKQWGEWLVGEDPQPDNPREPRFVFADGEEVHIVSDGWDILLINAEEHRGPPQHLWREYWASGTGELLRRVGKKAAGALLDGREHRDMPR